MKPAIRTSLFLIDHEVDFETLVHPPAYSSQRLAKYLRVSGQQVAKSVLIACPGGYYLAVLPSTHRVDFSAIGQVLGVPARLACENEMAALFNDCEQGAMTPFGGLYGLSTLLDDSFAADARLVFAAQRHSLAIRMRCEDFERVERPRRFRFAMR